MLKNVPVQLEGYKLRVSEAPTVKMYTNDKGQEEIQTDFHGATLHVVSLFVKARPQDGRPAPKGFEAKVTLETAPEDEFDEGVLVELINPRISQWQNERGSGVSLKATGIKLAG
ncbi:hypothetical protein HUO13_02410 [Saccharopolyspora erythraea]|uniref:hypothetical protein n=1 Tax=Saccharopolyspora erythraea TaxID=1836 RepID=UPI001BAD168F|nr:hypothetical protein [Saccharopolyspora erythraea]QUG99804.1 hypothetical protein HUO13_02410 [Saccharopolyspora erythraea]